MKVELSKLLEDMSGDELVQHCIDVYNLARKKKDEESSKTRILSDEKREEVLDKLADEIDEHGESSDGDTELYGNIQFPLIMYSDEYIVDRYLSVVGEDDELYQEVLGIIEMDKMLKRESV